MPRLFHFSIMACYDNIIGLSRADCPCTDTEAPTGFNTSLSGLYITDGEPFSQLGDWDNCSAGSSWDLLSRSREEAIATFTADTNSLLMRHFSPRREAFKGQIGEASGRETLDTTHTYAGARIACAGTDGGQIRITQIGTLFSASGTIALTVYNSLNTQVASRTLTVANGWHLNTLDTPITLPTKVAFSDRHEYFFVYTYSAANKPKRNAINCGCGGFSPWYDIGKPMWDTSAYTSGRAWANWVMAGGWTGDTLTDFDRATESTTTALNGLAFQIETGCDISKILCNGSLNYTTDPFALSQAYAIRYKTWEILASKMLASGQLTRINVTNRDQLRALRQEWNQAYVENIQYIAQEASVHGNGCLTCRNVGALRVDTILS